SEDLLGLGVDNFSSGGKSISTVDAERDPAGLLTKFNAYCLSRRHDGGVEKMQPAVGRVAHPDFLFIRSQANAMTRTAVPLGRSLSEALNFHTIKLFARREVADFKTEQSIYVHEAARPSAVDRERSNGVGKWPNLSDGFLISGIDNREQR